MPQKQVLPTPTTGRLADWLGDNNLDQARNSRLFLLEDYRLYRPISLLGCSTDPIGRQAGHRAP